MLVLRRRRGGLLGGGIEVISIAGHVTGLMSRCSWIRGMYIFIVGRRKGWECCYDTQCRCSTA